MKRRRVFRKIFILSLLVFVLSIGVIEFYVTHVVREDHIRLLRDNLLSQAGLIEEIMGSAANYKADSCDRLMQKSGVRVTLIMGNGTVVCDSLRDPNTMDNHTDRTEIQQSLLSGTGWAVRHSDTVGQDLLYAARKVVSDGKVTGFIRLSIPVQDVYSSASTLRNKIILVVSLVLLLTVLIAMWQIEHIRRLILQINEFSRSIASGRLEGRLFLRGGGEFDEIARNLNNMSLELKKIIETGEEEKKRLKVILKSVPDALLIIDAKGVVLHASTATREIFSEEVFSGRPYIEIVRNYEFSSLMNAVHQSLESGSAEIVIDDPEEKHLLVRVSPVFYRETELSGYIAIFHNITQIKKLEQVRKDFVANVSHEIKTPITSITGFADTLLDGAIDDRENAMKFLRTIKSNSERINRLVDDLMTISKIELGVIRVEKNQVVMQDIAEHLMTVFRDRAGAKNLDMSYSTHPDHTTVSADRDRLIQIFSNLIENAIKFTESGAVTFGVENGERPFLFVQDTGVGIAKKHIQRLGERFYRVDPARSRKLGGTGLGLSIVKHLVKAHHWEMKIESTEGKGTIIRIFMDSAS